MGGLGGLETWQPLAIICRHSSLREDYASQPFPAYTSLLSPLLCSRLMVRLPPYCSLFAQRFKSQVAGREEEDGGG